MERRPKRIANVFIGLAGPAGLTPVKLVKLVCIGHGWHLAVLGEPLVAGGWGARRFGPTIRRLDSEIPLTDAPLHDFLRDESPSEQPLARQSIELIEKVWHVYGSLDERQLVALTSNRASVWAQYVPEHQREALPANIRVAAPEIPDDFVAAEYTKIGRERYMVR